MKSYYILFSALILSNYNLLNADTSKNDIPILIGNNNNINNNNEIINLNDNNINHEMEAVDLLIMEFDNISDSFMKYIKSNEFISDI